MAKPQNVTQKTRDLKNFIEDVKSISGQGVHQHQIIQRVVDDSYANLYEHFKTLSDKEIQNNFSETDVKLIGFLHLGAKQERVFVNLANIIAGDAQVADRAVVEFLKSREGFDAINANFKKFEEDELVAIFGSLFGVKLAKEAVASFRTERLGSVLGYATSGLAQHHIEEWNKSKTLQKVPLSQYLIEQIKIHDVTLSYDVVQDDRKGLVLTAEVIPQINRLTREGKPQSGRRADHCFINPFEKTIVLGFSVGNKTPEEQSETFAVAIRAVELMVKNDPKYAGYTIKPFYLSSGRFVSNTEQDDFAKRDGFSVNKTLENVDQSDRQALGQLSTLGIAGNLSLPASVVSLMKFNHVICGTDSLDLYEFSQSLSKLPSSQQLDAVRDFLCNKFTMATRAINNSLMSNYMYGESHFQSMVGDIERFVGKINRLFTNPMSQQDFDRVFAPLLKETRYLVEKYSNETSYKTTNFATLDTYLSGWWFDNAEGFNRFLQKPAISLDRTPTWQDPDTIKMTIIPSAKPSRDNLHPIVYIGKHLATDNYSDWNDIKQQRFARYVELLHQIIVENKTPQNAIEQVFPEYQDSRDRLSWFLHQLRDDLSKKPKAEQFVEATQFLTQLNCDITNLSPVRLQHLDYLNDWLSQSTFQAAHAKINKEAKTIVAEVVGEDTKVKVRQSKKARGGAR